MRAADPVGAAEADRLLLPHLRQGALLAVSGGPDSMALLGLAARVRAARPDLPPLHVFTFDHGLRPESAAEAAMVGEASQRLGARHHLDTWRPLDRPARPTHDAARRARYRAAILCAGGLGIPTILTAHHCDDQIETAIMRRRRSFSARSLAGIAPLIAGRNGWPSIARPLLDVSRLRLRVTAVTLGLPFVDDPSNREPAFERTRVRLALARLVEDGLAYEDDDLAEAARMARDEVAGSERGADLRLSDAEVDAFGRIRTDASAFRGVDFHPGEHEAALRRALMGAAGFSRPPNLPSFAFSRADHLLRELFDWGFRRSDRPAVKHRTLHGVHVTMLPDEILFAREWGRDGPADLVADRVARDACARIVWDGRFLVGAPLGTIVRAFGRTGRGNPAERTLPALFDAAGRCLAVPPMVAAKAPAGTRTDLDARCIVGARLGDAHIGGLYDKLIVGGDIPYAA